MYAQIDNILDYYVRLPSDLRDPAGKGSGLRFSYVICPWKAASRAGWGPGTIPPKYCAWLCSGTHCFTHYLARADSAP